MRTPFPFDPDWKADFADHSETGKGLLTASVKEKLHRLTAFTVSVGNTIVTAVPIEGKILISKGIAFRYQPGFLKWFRRMEFDMASQDTNESAKANCLWYGLGIGEQWVRVYEDGKVI